jgi:hypothetical protein
MILLISRSGRHKDQSRISTPHSLWLKSDKSGRVLHKINLEEQLLILWIKFQILAKSPLLCEICMVLISLFFRIGVFLHVHPIDNRNSRYQFEVFCVWATLSILIKSCIYLPSPAFAYLISFPRIKTSHCYRWRRVWRGRHGLKTH